MLTRKSRRYARLDSVAPSELRGKIGDRGSRTEAPPSSPSPSPYVALRSSYSHSGGGPSGPEPGSGGPRGSNRAITTDYPWPTLSLGQYLVGVLHALASMRLQSGSGENVLGSAELGGAPDT